MRGLSQDLRPGEHRALGRRRTPSAKVREAGGCWTFRCQAMWGLPRTVLVGWQGSTLIGWIQEKPGHRHGDGVLGSREGCFQVVEIIAHVCTDGKDLADRETNVVDGKGDNC